MIEYIIAGAIVIIGIIALLYGRDNPKDNKPKIKSKSKKNWDDYHLSSFDYIKRYLPRILAWSFVIVTGWFFYTTMKGMTNVLFNSTYLNVSMDINNTSTDYITPIASLMPAIVIFVIGFVLLGLIMPILRSAGLMGSDKDYEEEGDEEDEEEDDDEEDYEEEVKKRYKTLKSEDKARLSKLLEEDKVYKD